MCVQCMYNAMFQVFVNVEVSTCTCIVMYTVANNCYSFILVQQNASKESMKILMEMHDKVIKEKDQLKKQYDHLLKQNEQLKKKRKGSTDKLLASPDPPPEEDSTLLAIEFAHQRADDADKRAEEARAKVIEAERRVKEAEKYARAAHTGAESRVTKLEKQVDEERVVAQVS